MHAHDDRAEAANQALSWFGFAEVYSSGDLAAVKTMDSTLSVDESFDDSRIADRSQEVLVS